MNSSRNVPAEKRERRPFGVRHAAQAGGVLFLLAGFLGFVPGITTDFDRLGFAGPRSGALLLGLFQVSVLRNVLYLLLGIFGLALARTVSGSRNYLIWGGSVYLVFWVYGVVVTQDSAANFVPFNQADNWLHLVLGMGMLGLGTWLGRSRFSGRA